MYDEGAKTLDPDFHPGNARIGGTRLSAVAREKAAIEEEAQYLEKNLAVLHQFLDELTVKIDPILSPQLDDGGAPVRDTFGGSRLCHALYENNNTITRAISRIGDLTRRAEV